MSNIIIDNKFFVSKLDIDIDFQPEEYETNTSEELTVNTIHLFWDTEKKDDLLETLRDNVIEDIRDDIMDKIKNGDDS